MAKKRTAAVGPIPEVRIRWTPEDLANPWVPWNLVTPLLMELSNGFADGRPNAETAREILVRLDQLREIIEEARDMASSIALARNLAKERLGA